MTNAALLYHNIVVTLFNIISPLCIPLFFKFKMVLKVSFEKFQDASHLSETVKPVLSDHSKRRPKIGFQDGISLNAGQKY